MDYELPGKILSAREISEMVEDLNDNIITTGEVYGKDMSHFDMDRWDLLATIAERDKEIRRLQRLAEINAETWQADLAEMNRLRATA